MSRHDRIMLQEKFIERSSTKFPNRFKYYKVNFVNQHTVVTLTCIVHGDFETKPEMHLRTKYGCPTCAKTLIAPPTYIRKTNDQFIKDCREVHGDTYIYDKTDYLSRCKPIIITCRKHGDIFIPQAFRHLEGRGCKRCKIERQRVPSDKFFELCRKAHKDAYDYSESEYKGSCFPLQVICKKHGEFVAPHARVHSHGYQKCPTCVTEQKEQRGKTL